MKFGIVTPGGVVLFTYSRIGFHSYLSIYACFTGINQKVGPAYSDSLMATA